MKKYKMDISIIIPCLNEEKTIGLCVNKAFNALRQEDACGEVIVIDNGSTDNSAKRAKDTGARVIVEPVKGYGTSIRRGIKAAKGHTIIMGDGDNTYNFLDLNKFIQLSKNGVDIVIGNRLGGTIHKNAMPYLHRWLGTPVLTGILKLFYGSKISDVNCGMRAFKRTAIKRLNLQSAGMEIASEMIIKAIIKNLKIAEIPIDLFPAEPGRISHLNTYRDGWRHLRLILALYPQYLFLNPKSENCKFNKMSL